MKIGLKILTLAALVLAGLTLRSSAFASYAQNLSDGFTADNVNPGVILTGDALAEIGSFSGINSISIQVRNNSGQVANKQIQLDLYSAGFTNHCQESIYVDIPEGISNPIFNFANCVLTYSSTTATYLRFYLATSAAPPAEVAVADYTGSTTISSLNGYTNYIGGLTFPAPPTIKFAINTTLNDSYGINFLSGLANATTTDFSNWQFVVAAPSSTEAHIIVNYGLASSTNWYLENSDNYYWPTPLDNTWPINLTSGQTVLKKSDLVPEAIYKAKVFLNRNSDGYTLASSSEISFAIIGGVKKWSPTVQNAPNFQDVHPQCAQTNFQINFFGGVVDFGQGLCDVARFLFYPSNFTLDKYQQLAVDAKTKIPISGFYQILKVAQDEAATTTASSTLAFTYTSTSTPVHTFSINLKSKLISMIGQTSFDVLYNAEGYVIWFLVAVYGFFRIKHFF